MQDMSLTVDRISALESSVMWDDTALDALNYVRLVALDCRAAARADLFHACAVLSQDQGVAKHAFAETLAKCLPQVLGCKPVLYAPGICEMSFDEAWLVRLIQSSIRKDFDSFSFLIRSRVPYIAQRNLAFLIHSMSESFAKN